LIGLLDDRPYEVLGGLSKCIELPRKYTRGVIKRKSYKTKNSRYDLVIGENDDQFIIRDLVNTFDNPNYSAFTRTISLSLRHGVPINYLVEQLQKDKDADMFSFSRVVARTLKKYIEDGTDASSVKMEGCETPDKCQIKYIEGCATCATCGTSACS
jgi:ribonucleoside-diphosphate reductase alpha chain